MCVFVFFSHPGTEPTVWEDHGTGHRRAAPPASGSRRGGAGDWEGFQQVRRGGRILNPSWSHNRSKLINLKTTQHHLVPSVQCLSSFLLPWWRQQPFMECLMLLLELLISALSVVCAVFYTSQTPAVTNLNNLERLSLCSLWHLWRI